MPTVLDKDIGLTTQQITQSLAKSGNQKAQDALAKEQVQTSGPIDPFSQEGAQQLSRITGTPLPPVDNPVLADSLSPEQAPQLPQPAAMQEAQGFFESAQSEADRLRANIDSTLATQRSDVEQRLTRAQKEQEDILARGDEFTQPFREELETAERERLFVNQNFEKNQALVNELDSLLTQGNELIQRERDSFNVTSLQNDRTYRKIEEVQARAGVIQAVMAARNSQISQAYNLIDRTVNAMNADRQDRLSYFDTLLSLNNQKLLNLDAENKKIATEQLNLVKRDMQRAEATADYIKELMVTPEHAQFMADAGVTLDDDTQTINRKMSEQAKRQEIQDMANNLAFQGYDLVAKPVPGSSEIKIGGETLHYRVRPGSQLALEMERSRQAIRTAQIQQSQMLNQTSTASIIDSLFGEGPEPSVSFEDFLAERQEQAQMSFAPQAVEDLRREYESSVGTEGNKQAQLAQLVASGALTVQEAEFVQLNMDISSPDKQARQKSTIEIGKGVLRDVNRALTLADKAGPTAGILAESALSSESSIFSRMIGARSPALELATHLESIKSNISIEELQRMREASPTGGALGQVPVQQQEFLMSVKGSLRPINEPVVLKENLNDLYNIYLDAMFGSPEELSQAVRQNKMTAEEANQYLSQRKATSYNEFNIPNPRSSGQDISDIVVSPTGELVKIKQ